MPYAEFFLPNACDKQQTSKRVVKLGLTLFLAKTEAGQIFAWASRQPVSSCSSGMCRTASSGYVATVLELAAASSFTSVASDSAKAVRRSAGMSGTEERSSTPRATRGESAFSRARRAASSWGVRTKAELSSQRMFGTL